MEKHNYYKEFQELRKLLESSWIPLTAKHREHMKSLSIFLKSVPTVLKYDIANEKTRYLNPYTWEIHD